MQIFFVFKKRKCRRGRQYFLWMDTISIGIAPRKKDIKANRGNAGFSDEEREKMTALLNSGFSDTFRTLYPDRADAYTWWSYRFSAREKNVGWRIDYFIVSSSLMPKVTDSTIDAKIMGSDHCPVCFTVDL